MKIINLGITAHIDAGKTTITEQLLYHAGAIRTLGSVDRGTTHTDYMEVERKRGISVCAAAVSFMYNDLKINLIDTPGHTDFAEETERVLNVLDCAVLAISAVEGIQSRTEVLWKMLRTLHIPTLIFINKTDRVGADVNSVLSDIQKSFSQDAVFADGDITEALAERDENILDTYLNGGKISDELKAVTLTKLIKEENLFPVLSGSALKDEGIQNLLDFIYKYMPRAEHYDGEPSAIVFKVEHDKTMGRIAHIRMFGGRLKSRDTVYNVTREKDEKITQIRKFQGAKSENVDEVCSGDIASLCGLSDTVVGDVLGNGGHLPPKSPVTEPMLRVRVIPEDEGDYPKLVSALQELQAENPSYKVIWEKTERQLLINISGVIRLEVLSEVIRDRFDLNVTFGQPCVIYKETPSSIGYGFVAYTMPKPCWAVIKFLIEPGERGSGVQYKSIVENNKIYYRYQSQIEDTIQKSLEQGPLGWEVTDLKITLVDGEHHTVHTHPLDFIVATPMAMMDGLMNTGTTLLEPVMNFEITAPEEYSGKIIGDIISMRGTFEISNTENGVFKINGKVPLATSMDYPIKLASQTSGTGIIRTGFCGYEPTELENGRTVPYRGINPIDKAKYILYIRSALE